MATSKQEQIYNEIIEYYNYADRLIRSVENSSHKLAPQQFEIVEEVVSCLEECADKLANKYIEFVKNGSTDKAIDLVRVSMNDISAKIEECRNKILMLHRES
jgi:hypothetical protein